jgi:hypothetical protein
LKKGASRGTSEMDYLFLKLIWWIAAAFALGILVGWFSCRGGKKT